MEAVKMGDNLKKILEIDKVKFIELREAYRDINILKNADEIGLKIFKENIKEPGQIVWNNIDPAERRGQNYLEAKKYINDLKEEKKRNKINNRNKN
jgi:hypothetical protein